MLQAQAGPELRTDPSASLVKPKVTVISKNGHERVIQLRGPVTFLGAHREVQIRLKHHTIAPAHCAIINTGSSLILRDLASRSGTKLNGETTTCAKLSDGDIIRIAGWKFRVAFNRRSGTGCGGSSIAAVRLDAPSGMSIESVETGKRWVDLPEIIVIGRRGACDVYLDRDGVSRSHAMICTLDGRTAIFDLKSANGVKVNGQRTSMSYLSPGDLVTIGGHELRVGDPRNIGDRDSKPCDSSSVFDGVADERITLSHSDDAPSFVGFMDVAGAAPELTNGSGLRAVPDRRDRLGMRFDQQAGELSALEGELTARDKQLADREAVLHKREVALDARNAELEERIHTADDPVEQIEARSHAAATREAWLDTRAKELDEREGRLDKTHEELELLKEGLLQNAGEPADTRSHPTVANLCDVEQKLAARGAVLKELAKSLDVRAMEIDAVERRVRARQPILTELSKSLDARADELDAKHREVMKMKSETGAWREELAERTANLDERDNLLHSQEEVLRMTADPMAVSDDRSYEILRLLDPVLGDSVRVLRRLGIGGSFDELVERAKCELSAGERDKKSRGKWNLFN